MSDQTAPTTALFELGISSRPGGSPGRVRRRTPTTMPLDPLTPAGRFCVREGRFCDRLSLPEDLRRHPSRPPLTPGSPWTSGLASLSFYYPGVPAAARPLPCIRGRRATLAPRHRAAPPALPVPPSGKPVDRAESSRFLTLRVVGKRDIARLCARRVYGQAPRHPAFSERQ